MKRLLVLVAVLVPLSLFTAGCGDTGGPSTKSSSAPTADQSKEMQEKMKANYEKTMQGAKPGAMPSAPAK
jgi:hypothetical protein